MDIAAVVAAGIRNQVSHLRHLALHSANGTVDETDDYLIFAGSHDYPGTYTNGVIRKTPAISAAELIARADAFFAALGRGYYLWAQDGPDFDLERVAQRRGFLLRPPASGIPCFTSTAPVPAVESPAGYSIEVAHTDEQRRDYLEVIARNYDLDGMPLELAEAVLFSLDSLRSPQTLVLLARSDTDDQVHGGISAFLSDECVGLEWTATDTAARGRGLGSVLMQRAAAWGFEQGARSAWGCASQQGVSVWRKLGFDVPTHFRRYLAQPSG